MGMSSSHIYPSKNINEKRDSPLNILVLVNMKNLQWQTETKIRKEPTNEKDA